MRFFYFPARSMYVFALAAAAIFAMPFVWYVTHTFFAAFQTVGGQLITDLGTNDSTTDAVETFLNFGDTYILVLFLIGLGFWVWVQTQKRGPPVYAY